MLLTPQVSLGAPARFLSGKLWQTNKFSNHQTRISSLISSTGIFSNFNSKAGFLLSLQRLLPLLCHLLSAQDFRWRAAH